MKIPAVKQMKGRRPGKSYKKKDIQKFEQKVWITSISW